MKKMLKTNVLKRRNLLAIVFAAVIGFSFFACGGPNNGGDNSDNSETNPDNSGSKPDGLQKESSEYPGFYYIDSGNTITITKYESKSGNRDITIPSKINGKPVTDIGPEAFKGCTSLTSITIPSSVTKIENYAFQNCTGLTSITIPDGVTEIGWEPFRDCTGLAAINVNAANTEYSSEGGVLYNKDKTELIRCPQAKTGALIIPNSVTQIWARSFYGCAGLTAITIPYSVKNDELLHYFDELNLNSQLNITWYNPTGKGGGVGDYITLTVIILDGVTSIGDYAFSGCTGLISITIPNSVTSIGEGAFRNCTGLTAITIPNSITSIGDCAFEDCTGLTSVNIPNSVTSIGGGAFRNCTGLTSVNIPNNVTSIRGYAFQGCTGLTNITIPSSVTSIGDLVISGCTGLTSITIDCGVFNFRNPVSNQFVFVADKYPNLTEINVNAANTEYSSEDGVLYNKDKTELIYYPQAKTGDFTVPDSVTTVAWWYGAFVDCTGLTAITIPANASITSQDYVFPDGHHQFSNDIPFSGCTNLTSITVDPANKNFKSYYGVLYNKPPFEEDYNVLLRCPQAKTGGFVVPDNVTNIAIRAFEDCAGLTNITIPDSVTKIGWMAFRGCTNLTKVWFKGTISSDNFGYWHSFWPGMEKQSFPGDLRDKFYAYDSTNGTPGIYTTKKPVNEDSKWGIIYVSDSTYSNSSRTASFYLKYNGDFVYYTNGSMTYPGTWTFSGDTIYTPLGSFTVIDEKYISHPTLGTWNRER